MNKQEIANELSKIYLENNLILEKEKYNRNYNIIEITRIYLSNNRFRKKRIYPPTSSFRRQR